MRIVINTLFVCMALFCSCDNVEQPDQVPEPDSTPDLTPDDGKDTVNVHVSAIPTEDAVDLSATEAANCYMVSAPGIYSFKSVKGNSNEAVESVSSVSVLWETWGTTEQVTANSVVAEADFEADMIYIRVAENFHPGNAVVAAKNDAGKILWSWHIWIPETPVSEDLYGVSRRKSMSRNLGALVDASTDGASAKSAGLFYQWGRKDPFVGAGDFSTGAPATVAGVSMTKSGGQMTVEDAVASPTVFADNNGSWTDSSEKLWNRDKSMYDPCPPGYRLPYGSEHILFSNPPDEIVGCMYDEANDIFAVGKPATTYPLGGYISQDGTYKSVGKGTWLWSSRPASAVTSAFGCGLELEGDEASYSNATTSRANAYAVRCLSVDAVPFENAPGTPVKGAYEKYTVKMQELSGLCLHTDGSFLWGVGDQGVLAKVGFDASMEKVYGKGIDMESVTIDPQTNDLYLGCEPNYVYRIPAPDYNTHEEVFRVEEAKGYGNSGIEGISWYKDGLILVGTQVGAYMWAYRLDGTPVWRKSMGTVALGMKEIADICYDPVKDQIWIIDSETQSIYLFNGDATEHLATYKVSYGGNCESLYIDYANNCIWMADDTDESKLFKIEFEF